MRSTRSVAILGVGLVAALLVGPAAQHVRAEPLLQLYVEGGAYNQATESWELSPEGSSAGEPFRLWTIGWTTKPGGPPGTSSAIDDVRLAIAYDQSFGQLDINLTPTRIGGNGSYQGFSDPQTPGNPVFNQYNDQGDVPQIRPGRDLPTHGVYDGATVWQEFGLGDFDQQETPIADFIDGFPDQPSAHIGQINAYDVQVLPNGRIHNAQLHFDLYGNPPKGNFSPFSHDADVTTTIIPLPRSTGLALGGLGLLAIGAIGRRRRRLAENSA